MSSSSLNTSSIFPKSTVAASSGGKSLQTDGTAGRQTSKQHTIKLVTIPLTKDGERSGTKSSNQLILNRTDSESNNS